MISWSFVAPARSVKSATSIWYREYWWWSTDLLQHQRGQSDQLLPFVDHQPNFLQYQLVQIRMYSHSKTVYTQMSFYFQNYIFVRPQLMFSAAFIQIWSVGLRVFFQKMFYITSYNFFFHFFYIQPNFHLRNELSFFWINGSGRNCLVRLGKHLA